MVKVALLLLALVAYTSAKPYGGAVVSQDHHVTSSVVSPHLGIGYGMMGYGMNGMGHSISTHSISHAVPHYGMGMMGIKGLGYGGMYPGMGYGGYGGYGGLMMG